MVFIMFPTQNLSMSIPTQIPLILGITSHLLHHRWQTASPASPCPHWGSAAPGWIGKIKDCSPSLSHNSVSAASGPRADEFSHILLLPGKIKKKEEDDISCLLTLAISNRKASILFAIFYLDYFGYPVPSVWPRHIFIRAQLSYQSCQMKTRERTCARDLGTNQQL